jgi:hypothetical protein
VEAYEEDYRHVLARVRDELGAWLVLVGPFLVPVTAERWAWREDPDPRIQPVRPLAEEFDVALPADGLMNQAARAAGSTDPAAHDGVHPAPFGHRVLAQARGRPSHHRLRPTAAGAAEQRAHPPHGGPLCT